MTSDEMAKDARRLLRRLRALREAQHGLAGELGAVTDNVEGLLFEAKVLTSFSKSGQESPTQEHAPICAVHQIPMLKVQGKKGEFWSCHQKDGDTWCSYRPSMA